MKRLFDILFASFVLLCFLPFGIIISLWIVLGSNGGAFYRQVRVGQNGKDFELLKFRTMRPNADSTGKLTVGMRDPRITSVGFFLRKYKLDEFPQFWNVLIGDMSIVGPRPEVREYVNLYNADQQRVLLAKPGITDYASLEYFTENEILGASETPEKTYIQEVMPAKLKLNLKYIDQISLGTDLKIIGLTFLKIFRHDSK